MKEYVTFKEFNEVVQSEAKFRKFLIKLLKKAQSEVDYKSDTNKGVPLVKYGSDDGYYWDYTSVELNQDNKTLTVTFNIGSGSGYIPYHYTEYNVSIENFRQYLINRKWQNKNINTIELLIACINEIDGVELIEDKDEYDEI